MKRTDGSSGHRKGREKTEGKKGKKRRMGWGVKDERKKKDTKSKQVMEGKTEKGRE